MSEASLFIRNIPSALIEWLAMEASRNARSIEIETVRLLEEARALREGKPARCRDVAVIASILRDLQALPLRETFAMDTVLYDETGMPK